MESVSVHAPNTQIPGLKHVMPTAIGELLGAQPVNNGSFPVMFGYSSIQLLMLDNPHHKFRGINTSFARAAVYAPLYEVFDGRRLYMLY
ncbi:hypothetical protein RJT34_12166 [Clitoria ternatea]|uniref:Uncharacterized protein n=1 Tax=Clitoria ternatea TaxID=43366 RepID=A0AAN9JL93_CLITE